MGLPYPIENKFGETLSPSGHMRERGAAALYTSRPSHFKREHELIRSSDPLGCFFMQDAKMRDFHERWFDHLLFALDKVGLRIVEINDEPW